DQGKNIRVRSKECPQLRGIIQKVLFVVNEPASQLILLRDVEVHALHEVCPALPSRWHDRDIPYFHAAGRATAICRRTKSAFAWDTSVRDTRAATGRRR